MILMVLNSLLLEFMIDQFQVEYCNSPSAVKKKDLLSSPIIESMVYAVTRQ